MKLSKRARGVLGVGLVASLGVVALAILSWCRKPHVPEELRPLLDPRALSTSEGLKRAVERAAQLRDRKYTEALCSALESSRVRVRAVAAVGLKALSDPSSADALMRYLRTHDPVRLAAKAEKSRDPGRRREGFLEGYIGLEVIDALGNLAVAEAEPQMRKLIGSNHWGTNAAVALVKIRGAGACLKENPATDHAASNLASGITQGAVPGDVPALIAALTDAAVDSTLRTGAARALRRMRTGDAVPSLASVALDKGESPTLRIACAGAAGAIGGSGQLKLLEALAKSRDNTECH